MSGMDNCPECERIAALDDDLLPTACAMHGGLGGEGLRHLSAEQMVALDRYLQDTDIEILPIVRERTLPVTWLALNYAIWDRSKFCDNCLVENRTACYNNVIKWHDDASLPLGGYWKRLESWTPAARRTAAV